MMLMQVSIAEGPVTVVVKREAMSPAGEGRRDSSNRASIIQVTFLQSIGKMSSVDEEFLPSLGQTLIIMSLCWA